MNLFFFNMETEFGCSVTGVSNVTKIILLSTQEYSRVWLLCELKVSQLLPKFIVDYTAKRAMPRATNWLKPHVEAEAEKWAGRFEYK